jgi:AAA+ superfamily predicted ATPase
MSWAFDGAGGLLWGAARAIVEEMSADPVVLALRAALSAGDDAGSALRLALGRRLLELGLAADALQELEVAIGKEPSNREVLEAAVRAAEAAGEAARADAYKLARDRAGPRVGTEPTGGPPITSNAAVPPGSGAPQVPVGGAVGAGATESRQAVAPPQLRLVGADEAPPEPARPAVTFADVGGLEDVKQRLTRSFLLPLRQPEVFARFGKSMRGGLLLYGPPGCGKTFIARALAGEIGARFTAVGLSDVLDMWLGESERKLHELFENARREAPAVLFFDEVDAIGQRRSNFKGSAGRNVVNQLLAEMDGIASSNTDLFVLGATNHPWDVDTALRRPGRFDRLVFVPAPDLVARERILSLRLTGRPTAAALGLAKVARKADGFSGADLAALADAATELAFERTVTAGREHVVDDALLEAALKDMSPSTGPWLETARNYALYSNEGGAYDDLLAYLKTRKMA